MLERTVAKPLHRERRDRQPCILDRYVDRLALPRPQRGQRCQRGRNAALHGGEMPIDLQWRPVGEELRRQAVRQQEAFTRSMDRVDFVRLPASLWAMGPERQHRDVYQVRELSGEVAGVESRGGTFLDRRIIDQDGRILEQRLECGAPLGTFEIADEALLSGRQIGEERAYTWRLGQEGRLPAQWSSRHAVRPASRRRP